jgi:ubiquitin C-terminal hydrolase
MASVSLNSGIANPGNFCYINSSIQCFRHIKPVINLINENSDFDSYIGDILNLLGIKGVLDSAEIKARVARVNANTEDMHMVAQINKIITEHASNQEEFDFMLNKVELECYKIYLYVGLRNLLTHLNQSINQTVDASNFYKLCNYVTRGTGMDHIVNGGQNDCVEFLMCIIDYLHDSHSIPVKTDINPEILNITDAELDKMALPKRIKYGLIKDIHMRYSKSYTSFNKELYFYNLNMVKCGKCEYVGLNYSPYNMLCLPIREENVPCTIYDCMDKLFCKEALDCEYKCEKCKNTEGNTMEKKILTKPTTLTVCLKRFDFKVLPGGFGMPIKINSLIEYPHVLNISKYYPIIPGDEAENVYRLVGVINHIGMMNYGHYFSYCYDTEKECWFNYNDHHVSRMDAKDVIHNPNAYVLFYEKM